MRASDLKEPLTLASENGVLDILMVAKSAPVETLPSAPNGWVYEICKRPPSSSAISCPPNGAAPNYYGGTLLQLQGGDTLRVHLINRLPLAVDSKHAADPGHDFLMLNPTNLHTHGMLVSPNGPTPGNPTYGDNVFVLTFNSANGLPTTSSQIHSDIRYDFTDYEIKVPKNHPSGLFWFHPHSHGLALNQLSAGLSGIITVGSVSNYLCKNQSCAQMLSQVTTRHIILKDMQVLAQGQVQTQEDPEFCAPEQTSGEPARNGSCQQQPGSDMPGTNPSNNSPGNWYFTLNGQVYPTIPMKAAGGEIWRITNASGSATYDLSLWNPAFGRNMAFQVISVDGVSLQPTKGKVDSQIAGAKFRPEACPGLTEEEEDDDSEGQPICTHRLHMMPSSRVEVWVTPRDNQDLPAQPRQGDFAILRNNSYTTGISGDTWPTIDLARVAFQGGTSAAALPKALGVTGEAKTLLKPTAISADLADNNTTVSSEASCRPLPPGHMRRVFYGVPTTNLEGFGLAYEEVDEHGKVVGPVATDLVPFDPMNSTVCVPLGPGNTPTVERWQLVNVATEDHNFHIHQVKFRVVTKDELAGTVLPKRVLGASVMLDNVPLPSANGTCGNDPPADLSNPIADWRAGLCKSNPITVEIPFAVAGDFVYHCHILEHEDGGMMARITVKPTP